MIGKLFYFLFFNHDNLIFIISHTLYKRNVFNFKKSKNYLLIQSKANFPLKQYLYPKHFPPQKSVYHHKKGIIHSPLNSKSKIH